MAELLSSKRLTPVDGVPVGVDVREIGAVGVPDAVAADSAVCVAVAVAADAEVEVGVEVGASVDVGVGDRVLVGVNALAVAVAAFPGAPGSDSQAMPSWSPSNPNGSCDGPPAARKKLCASCHVAKALQVTFGPTSGVAVGRCV